MKRIALGALVALVLTAAVASNQTIIIAPGDTITITAPTGGTVPGIPPAIPPAIPPPTGWNGTCPGFAKTLVLDMPWILPRRLYTHEHGGFGVNDALVVRFTTGAASTTFSLVTISGAEWNSSPSWRIATLSDKPCDFGAQSAPGATITGNSVTAKFAINGNGFGYYPVLQTNTTYYLNVKNGDSPTCAQSGVCDMFVDLLKPGGL